MILWLHSPTAKATIIVLIWTLNTVNISLHFQRFSFWSVVSLSHAPRVWRLWTLAITQWVMKGSTSWKTDWLPTALCSDWALLPQNYPAKVGTSACVPLVQFLWRIFAVLHFVTPVSFCHLCYRSCGCGWIHRWEPQIAASGPSREWDQDRWTDGPVARPKSQHLPAASWSWPGAEERNCEHGDKAWGRG